jgi:hypothetical protein
MQFVLTGFKQDLGFRVFAFARVEADRTRTEYTVRADLAVSRKYLIPMQELPLLCRNLLAGRENLDQDSAVTFSEEDMRLYASNCAAARQAAKDNRKPSQRPVSANLGAAWRGYTRPDPAHLPTTQRNRPGERSSVSAAAPTTTARDPILND